MDGCARVLREAIVEGELSPGEKLLPERELARRLGVNRVTIRSALARLATGRLLDVRQGSGYRVRNFRRQGGPELLPLLVAGSSGRKKRREVCRDLLLVRRTLLQRVVERASEESTTKDRARVRATVEALAAAGDDPDRWSALERDVIDALLDASHSLVLTLVMNPLLALLDPLLEDAVDPQPCLDAFQSIADHLDQGPHGGWIADAMAELTRRDLLVISQLPRR